MELHTIENAILRCVQVDNKIESISGEKVIKDGYYVYFQHCEVNEYDNCFVTNKAKCGLYLSKGSTTPQLGSCPHKVIWRLIK